MKRTLKLYSGDQGGTPGTPDRREKSRTSLSISMRTTTHRLSRRTMCPSIRVRYISRAAPLKTLGRFSLILRRSVSKD